MKILIAIILLVLLGFGGFLLTSNRADAPSAENETAESASESEASSIEGSSDSEASESDASSVAADNAVEGEVIVDVSPEALTTEVEPESLVLTLDSFNYGYSEEVIRVKQGTEVTINLTNSGGFHDWVVDEFSAATAKITAGDTTSVTFVASEKGSYEYYCSVGNHRAQGMVGTLIVE